MHILKRGNFALNEVSVSKILVFRREGDPSYSFVIIIFYLLEARKFFFLVDALDSWFWGRGEDRIASAIVSCLSAVEAKTFLNTNLSFLWSELSDVYDIHVHSIWVLDLPSGGRGEVRAYRRKGGFVVFGLPGHDLVGLVPLGFGIPFIDGGGYRVHRVDVVHECQVESFSEEGDKDSLVDYPTEMSSNFELVDIGEDLILGLCDGLEAGEGFCLEVGGEEGLNERVLEVNKGSKLLVVDGIRDKGCCSS